MSKLGELGPGGKAPDTDAMNLDKLMLLRRIVKGYVFQDEAARGQILPTLVQVLAGHLRTSGPCRIVAVCVLNEALHVAQLHKPKNEAHFSDTMRQLTALMPEVLGAVESALEDEGGDSVGAIEEAVKRDTATEVVTVKPLSDAATCLLSLLHLQSKCSDASVAELNVPHLRGILSSMAALMVAEVYAADWLVMNMFQYEVTLLVLEFAAAHLNAGALSAGDECDALLFDVGLQLLLEETLDLGSAKMTTARRDYIENVGKYGDLRVKVQACLLSRWANVSVAKRGETAMIDLMVKKLLELVSSSSPAVSKMSRDMFFELLQAEFKRSGNFLDSGRHAIDAIDDIMASANKAATASGASAAKEPALLVMFRDELSGKFAADADLNTPEATRFLTETTELFGLLRDLASHPKTADYEDDRIYAYTKLMEFLERLKRHEYYVKNSHAMSKEMSALGLHAEAASALLLHAKLLAVDSPRPPSAGGATVAEKSLPDSVSQMEHLLATLGVATGCHGDCLGAGAREELPDVELGGTTFPRQTALARRAKIYEMAMELFERGQQWELALELAEALKRQFSTVTFELSKLPPLLRKSAEWFEAISNVERYYPSLFRVAYYGQKYPAQIRNLEFVYRGAPLEQIIDFSARVKTKFPGAVMLDLKTAIGPEHTDQAETYFMAISKLAPSTRPEMRAEPASGHISDPALPTGVKLWRQNNCLDTFSYRRPYNKRKESGLKKSANSTVFFASENKEKALETDGEFRDLWVEFKYVRSAKLFPCVQRRLPCVELASVFRNPIEMAVETMEGKNSELEVKIALMETLPDGGADQSYTMALNGVVDAAVNGGLANYVSFMDGTYKTLNPEIHDDIERFPLKQGVGRLLSKLVNKQIELMDRGIKVHSSKVCDAMKPLGAYMEGNYQKMRKDALHWANKE